MAHGTRRREFLLNVAERNMSDFPNLLQGIRFFGRVTGNGWRADRVQRRERVCSPRFPVARWDEPEIRAEVQEVVLNRDRPVVGSGRAGTDL